MQIMAAYMMSGGGRTEKRQCMVSPKIYYFPFAVHFIAVTLNTCIREYSVRFSVGTLAILTEAVCDFPQSFQVPRLGHYLFLPNLFQFIKHSTVSGYIAHSIKIFLKHLIGFGEAIF
jgi:hypothetical protein